VRRLCDKTLGAGRRQIIFEHEWRDEFVGEALTLEVDATERLAMMEFYSAKLGVVRWSSGTGLGAARPWEDEEVVGRGLAGPRATLLDRGVTPATQPLNIIEAVLAHFGGTRLEGAVRAALEAPQLPHIIDAPMVDGSAAVPAPANEPKPGLTGRLGRAMRGLIVG
jgi:hypothetical protein